jgi:hypothetical protein
MSAQMRAACAIAFATPHNAAASRRADGRAPQPLRSARSSPAAALLRGSSLAPVGRRAQRSPRGPVLLRAGSAFVPPPPYEGPSARDREVLAALLAAGADLQVRPARTSLKGCAFSAHSV